MALNPQAQEQTMREFIAVTDDLLYANPQLRARLVPYGVDLPCRRLAVSPLHDTPPADRSWP